VMFLMRPRKFLADRTEAEGTSASRSYVFRVSRAEACVRVLFGELVLDLVVCWFCRIHLSRSLVLFSVARTMRESQGRVRQ
jgi:hypothetical protein